MSDNYLALLGTKGGPSVRPGSTMPTSSLLCLDGRLIVVDCGLGVTRGLVDQGMRLESLSLMPPTTPSLYTTTCWHVLADEYTPVHASQDPAMCAERALGTRRRRKAGKTRAVGSIAQLGTDQVVTRF